MPAKTDTRAEETASLLESFDIEVSAGDLVVMTVGDDRRAGRPPAPRRSSWPVIWEEGAARSRCPFATLPGGSSINGKLS